ncbi:retropepsin-like aspartic protease [Virgibacillus halodenitrificans]|uniref:retropepsin-like aspartic protease n=1 Tax=Virgibacillus halodenitrificans TaxID=1482 RepID=UPI001F3328E5|nr:retropepsin-like aspartic protease [Virgibacillus halodenitrificans]
MNLLYDGQLITTSLTLIFRGKTIRIEDVVVDTGSSHTVISPDVLETIGVTYENGDTIYEAYGIGGSVPFYTKKMDEIQIDSYIMKDFQIDVGTLPKDHSALLGLDVLKQYNFVIDLGSLELYPSMIEKKD